MAKRKQARDQQTMHDDAIVQELVAEVQAIAERRQCAVRFHQLMNQGYQLEIPVQYERLVRRAPPRPEAHPHDHHRGTRHRRRRRLSHARL